MMRAFPDPKAAPAYVPADDFEATLQTAWIAEVIPNPRKAERLHHLLVGYRAGVSAEEIIERIDAGEVDVA